VIRRRRECPACGSRFTTYERVEEPALAVVKRDGSREAFDPEKIVRGVLRACERRPVSMAEIRGLAADVEREVRARGIEEIPSRVIGELVMERLKALDQVAYIRFASVYRRFAEVEDFRREVDRLRREREGPDGLRQPRLFEGEGGGDTR